MTAVNPLPILYEASCALSAGRYIGVTKRGIAHRRRQHEHCAKSGRPGATALVRAIRKYGPHSFKWRVLAVFQTMDDALEAERRYIALFRPRYNVGPGGHRTRGAAVAADVGAKISLALRGRRRSPETIERTASAHRGMKRSTESRDRMRAAQLAIQARFAESGTHPLAKAVVCLDDGIVYRSATTAAAAYGAPTRGVTKACLGNIITTHGLHFAYAEAPLSDTERTTLLAELATRRHRWRATASWRWPQKESV